MNALRRIAIVVIVLMSTLAGNILLNDSFANGLGFDVFLAGSGSPWQLFINNDLVSGLLFATAWIVYRERGNRVLDTVTWVWMALWWGNIIVAVYVLAALRQSGGDAARFFMGSRAGALATVWPAPSAPLRVVLFALAAATLAGLGLILAGAGNAVAVVGSLLGFLPLALSFLLLALPATGAARAG